MAIPYVHDYQSMIFPATQKHLREAKKKPQEDHLQNPREQLLGFSSRAGRNHPESHLEMWHRLYYPIFTYFDG